MMTSKENYLASINFKNPDYVPTTFEDVVLRIQFEGNYKEATWTDLWGVEYECSIENTCPFPRHNPLKDLQRLENYKFPRAESLLLTDELRQKIKEGKNEGKIIFGELYHILFERIWALMGIESFMLALYEQPEELKFVLHKIAEFDRAVFERYIIMGLDGIYFYEDLGTQRALMISPNLLKEFFPPNINLFFKMLFQKRS